VLVPDSLDLLSLDTLDLSGRELFRSKWAVEELLEFSLLLTEPDVSFGLMGLTASSSRGAFTLTSGTTPGKDRRKEVKHGVLQSQSLLVASSID